MDNGNDTFPGPVDAIDEDPTHDPTTPPVAVREQPHDTMNPPPAPAHADAWDTATSPLLHPQPPTPDQISHPLPTGEGEPYTPELHHDLGHVAVHVGHVVRTHERLPDNLATWSMLLAFTDPMAARIAPRASTRATILVAPVTASIRIGGAGTTRGAGMTVAAGQSIALATTDEVWAIALTADTVVDVLQLFDNIEL